MRPALRTLLLAPVLFLLSTLVPTSILNGQDITATILGIVSDQTGAPVAGAAVTVTNEATGLSHLATTDATGSYLFPLLPIGDNYSVSVEASGFQRFVQRGIVLQVNDNIRVDAKLGVGTVTQTATVTGEATMIDTRASALGTVIDSQTIEQIPLNGRNPTQLASLVAGVTQITAPAVFTWRGGSSLSVNGSRLDETQFQVDGATYAGGYQNNGLNLPSPDALEEFKLITNNFPAEYGRNSGSIFNTVIKSGTNQIHGAVWEFLRNDKLNAKNYFLTGAPAKLDQNQFGFTAGGPAIKNRLFWFGSYQGLRIAQQDIATSFLPTAQERAGYFSTPINDPTTGQPIPAGPGGIYYISPTRFDPVVQNVLKMFIPVPQSSNGLVTFLGPVLVNTDQFVAKADGHITQKDSLAFTLLTDRTGRQDSLPNGNSIPNYEHLVASNNSSLFTGTYTYAFTPTLLNYARVSYARLKEPQECTNQQYSLAQLGSISFISDPLTPNYNPTMNVVGDFTLAAGLCGIYENSISRQASDNLTWIRGRHSFKFGGDLEKLSTAIIAFCCGTEGQYTFNGFLTGNTMADFLVGRPDSYTRASFGGQVVLHWLFGGYFQDDWRILPRLTLNLGLRYFLQTPDITDGLIGPTPNGHDGKAVFRPGQQSTVYPDAPEGLVYIHDAGIPRGVVQTDRKDWEPRVGLAWDVRGNAKTAVRAAYGIFHSVNIPDLTGQLNQNQPFILFDTLNAPPGGVYNTERGFPNPIPYRAYLMKSPTYIYPVAVVSQNAFYRQPMVQAWTADLQQQLSQNFVFDLAYAGKTSERLSQSVERNPAIYIPGVDANDNPLSTTGNVNSRRIYAPVFAQIRESQSLGRGNFNALEASAEYRLRYGLSFTAAYTWSKSIDTASSFADCCIQAQDPFNNLAGQRAVSDYDLTNVFALSYIYRVPNPFGAHAERVLEQVTGGWEISGITRLTSGFPYTLFSGVNNSLNGENQDRADVVGNPKLPTGRSRAQKVQEWFNTAAFQVNPIGRVGDSSRNMLRGPAQFDSDFAVLKNFPISERLGTLQFRSEFYNVLNQVQFSVPNNTVNSPSFGQITSAGNPRLIQFSLKYLF
jgi:hypothetical protein